MREAALVLQEAAEGAADEANVYVTAALLLLRTGNYSAAAIALAAVAQVCVRGLKLLVYAALTEP